MLWWGKQNTKHHGSGQLCCLRHLGKVTFGLSFKTMQVVGGTVGIRNSTDKAWRVRKHETPGSNARRVT